MYTEFSFGKLLRHLDGVEPLVRPADSPTEEHMRTLLKGHVSALGQPEFADFVRAHLALPRTGEDPVGTKPMVITGDSEDPLGELGQLLDVPFTPIRAEMTAPPTFSFGNKAAMSFRLWARVDGRDLTIDIIEVVTFDLEGHIVEQLAYWGADNVTILT